MENRDDSFRDRLLAHLPQPANLADYRQEVASMLEKNQKRIRRERLAVTAFWVFCAVSATIYLWFDPKSGTMSIHAGSTFSRKSNRSRYRCWNSTIWCAREGLNELHAPLRLH
jgi:hypothetical protein